MTNMTLLKLGLAAAGIMVFFFAHRYQNDRLRWVAIGLLVAAFLLRFVKRGGGKGEEQRLSRRDKERSG